MTSRSRRLNLETINPRKAVELVRRATEKNRARIIRYRQRAQEGHVPDPQLLRAYAKELGRESLTVRELIQLHRECEEWRKNHVDQQGEHS